MRLIATICWVLLGGSFSSLAEEPAIKASSKEPKEIAGKSAGPKLDGLLFFATDETVANVSEELQEDEKNLDPKLFADLRMRLGKAFGKSHFQLLGRHTQDVLKGWESWVVPSTALCLKIDSRGLAPNNGINLHIQLWREKEVLVKCDATLNPQNPIFIGGPNWRTGRLVFVVVQK